MTPFQKQRLEKQLRNRPDLSSAYPHYPIYYIEKLELGLIPTDYCDNPGWQKRNEGSLELLETDIRRQGLVNPIIIRWNSKYGDSVPVILVGGARVPVLKKIGYTHVPCVICGDRGKTIEGSVELKWEEPELHALFKDGYLGLNTTGLCMARCSNRSKGEVPGPDSPMSYREAISDVLYSTAPAHVRDAVMYKTPKTEG